MLYSQDDFTVDMVLTLQKDFKKELHCKSETDTPNNNNHHHQKCQKSEESIKLGGVSRARGNAVKLEYVFCKTVSEDVRMGAHKCKGTPSSLTTHWSFYHLLIYVAVLFQDGN